jgi:hypothetical protein
VIELGNVSRRTTWILFIVALILPYEIVIEVSGPFDAQSIRRIISGLVWAIETNGFHSMVGYSETTQFLFPIFGLSQYAMMLFLYNLFLVFLIILSLNGMIGYRITVYVLILSVIFPPVLFGLISIYQEMSNTLFLPIPAIQLIGLLILRHKKKNGAPAGT